MRESDERKKEGDEDSDTVSKKMDADRRTYHLARKRGDGRLGTSDPYISQHQGSRIDRWRALDQA